MPSNRFEWLDQVKAVEREHTATRYATEYLLNTVEQNPAILGRNLRVRDVAEASERLEGTYVIRLFAEFESGLRSYWFVSRKTEPPSRTRDLLDGVGAKRRIPHDTIAHAHQVREVRNNLIHEREKLVVPIPIGTARNYLCSFLSFLPLEW